MSIEKLIAALPSKTVAEREKMRSHAVEQTSSKNSKKAENAEKLIVALERFEREEREQLYGELRQMPVEERVIRAFTVEPMTETETKIIQVLLDNPGSTNRHLSQELGWKENGFDLHFGTMCRNRSPYLWPAPNSEAHERKFYSGILSDYDGVDGTFTMKPKITAAFAKLGLKGRDEGDLKR